MPSLGEALGKALGKPKPKEKAKKKSSPLRSLAKRWGVKDEEYDDFEVEFSEAVKESNS